MVQETGVPSQVNTKDLKKWYLMPPCLTLSIIGYGSRIKWSNSGKGVPGVVASEKGAFGSPSTRLRSPTYNLHFVISAFMLALSSCLHLTAAEGVEFCPLPVYDGREKLHNSLFIVLFIFFFLFFLGKYSTLKIVKVRFFFSFQCVNIHSVHLSQCMYTVVLIIIWTKR